MAAVQRWQRLGAAKNELFVWEVSWGKALTLDQIQKKGWALGNRCFLCQVCEETIDQSTNWSFNVNRFRWLGGFPVGLGGGVVFCTSYLVGFIFWLQQ